MAPMEWDSVRLHWLTLFHSFLYLSFSSVFGFRHPNGLLYPKDLKASTVISPSFGAGDCQKGLWLPHCREADGDCSRFHTSWALSFHSCLFSKDFFCPIRNPLGVLCIQPWMERKGQFPSAYFFCSGKIPFLIAKSVLIKGKKMNRRIVNACLNSKIP